MVLITKLHSRRTCSGYWSLGPHLCYINSFITMVIWMEHMIMFAMLKVDKMLISMLPVGKRNMTFTKRDINYSSHDILF